MHIHTCICIYIYIYIYIYTDIYVCVHNDHFKQSHQIQNHLRMLNKNCMNNWSIRQTINVRYCRKKLHINLHWGIQLQKENNNNKYGEEKSMFTHKWILCTLITFSFH